MLPIGWLYATYHLLREPETAIDVREYSIHLATGGTYGKLQIYPTEFPTWDLTCHLWSHPARTGVVKPNGEFSASHRVNLKNPFEWLQFLVRFRHVKSSSHFHNWRMGYYYSAWVSPLGVQRMGFACVFLVYFHFSCQILSNSILDACRKLLFSQLPHTVPPPLQW